MTRQIPATRAMEILDSRRNPTLRAFVTLDNWIVASVSASVILPQHRHNGHNAVHSAVS